MEFPDIGQNCSNKSCKRLDFLPVKCDACQQIFCSDHYQYSEHDCENAHLKNKLVPVCPLCNIPIPVGPSQTPDVVVGLHIDNNCKSDMKKNGKKISYSCSVKNCKTREVIPVVCNECTYNYCLKHRHPDDHKCKAMITTKKNDSYEAALSRVNNVEHRNRNGYLLSTQGSLSEDEALARALALSMNDAPPLDKQKQEELDLALARQLQQSEQATTAASRNTRNPRDRCNVS